jgi:hypothetical protein
MGLVTEPFKCLYADLDRMMKRRHRIVHEADLPSPEDARLRAVGVGVTVAQDLSPAADQEPRLRSTQGRVRKPAHRSPEDGHRQPPHTLTRYPPLRCNQCSRKTLTNRKPFTQKS